MIEDANTLAARPKEDSVASHCGSAFARSIHPTRLGLRAEITTGSSAGPSKGLPRGRHESTVAVSPQLSQREKQNSSLRSITSNMKGEFIMLRPLFLFVLVVSIATVPLLGQIGQTCNVTPDAQDSYTALLDHFNSSTLGQVHGSVSYGPSVSGLGTALQFSKGSWVEYPLSGWYQWSSDYSPAGKFGAIELWVKRANSNTGAFLVINWNDTTSPPQLESQPRSSLKKFSSAARRLQFRMCAIVKRPADNTRSDKVPSHKPIGNAGSKINTNVGS